MANLFDRLQETFTLPSNDNSNDASVDIEKEDSAKPNVTQENNGDAASRRGLVSAYTVNKQDGGKTKVVGTTSSVNADDAAKMKTESSFVIPKRKKDDTGIWFCTYFFIWSYCTWYEIKLIANFDMKL